MWRVTLRGLRARWLRLTLTALAVVVGVAFVAGTLVLTDAIARLVHDQLSTFSRGQVAVRSAAAIDTGVGGDRSRIPAGTLEAILPVPEVAAAEGVVYGPAQLVAPDGEAVDAAIPLGISWGVDDELSVLSLVDGEQPRADGQVAIDASTAAGHGIDIGDTVDLLFFGPAESFEVVGLLDYAGSSSRAFSTVAAFDVPTAQRVLNGPDQYDLIAVQGTDGTDTETLRRSVAAALPPGLEAVTVEELGEESSATLTQSLAFVEVLLLVFAGVGLVVGAFVIHNTFAMLVGQRTRELGLLRAMGAGGRQVWSSVLGEALAVGAVASAAGVALGFGLAGLLATVLDTVGLDVPRGEAQLHARTVVVGMAVGIVVTLIAAAWPARRAARVAPVEAMHDETLTPDPPSLRNRTVFGVIVVLAGLLAVVVGVLDRSVVPVAPLDDPRISVPIGAGVALAGVLVLGPAIIGVLARLLGAPFTRWGGVEGELACRNTERQPRRASATAASLLIGTCLVTFVALLAGSANTSVAAAIDGGLRAEWVLSGPQFSGFSPEVVARVDGLDEVGAASGFRLGFVGLGSTTQALYSVDASRLPDLVDLDVVDGSLDGLDRGGVLVHEQEADDFGIRAGDRILMTFPSGVEEIEVAGVFRNNGFTGNFVVNLLLSDAAYDVRFGEELDAFAYAVTAPRVPDAEARAAVEGALADFPNVELLTREEFKQDQHDQVNRVLSLFYMLLALAVLVAVFGIVNTLLLSVHERRREIGLLRTVGMSRRQVGAMVRRESLLVAVIGAVAGIATGVIVAWAVVSTLADDGIDRFAWRPLLLVGLLVAAGVIGVAAGALPARRAARADILDAIAEE